LAGIRDPQRPPSMDCTLQSNHSPSSDSSSDAASPRTSAIRSGHRRGRGSSIQEQTVGDNVGKLPWAAGTGNNLQGLSKRGQKPKEERAERERRMSLYERRRRSNVLSGDGSRLPNGG
jgi:hypothetical protein